MSLFRILSTLGPALLNALTPRRGYSLRRDIAYGPGVRETLDVYVPDGLTAPAPVLLFWYGGSWQSGARGHYRWLGQAFASRGIVTVVADYRLYPNARYPDFVHDSAAAFVFVHEHARDWGGDPGRIFLMGHSAGAYNAAMLASDLSLLPRFGGEASWIRGVIGVAGPYDFLPLKSADLIDIFGGDNVPATQPISHIDGPRAPMLLITGSKDTTVGPGNTKRMARKLEANGGEARAVFYPGDGHIGIILSLAPGFRGRNTLLADVLAFITAH